MFVRSSSDFTCSASGEVVETSGGEKSAHNAQFDVAICFWGMDTTYHPIRLDAKTNSKILYKMKGMIRVRV